MMVDHYGGDGDDDDKTTDGQWHRKNQPVQEFDLNNSALERKIKESFKGLMPESQ
jgi:hypothetical protein